VDRGWCQPSWQTKEWEWLWSSKVRERRGELVSVVVRGEGARSGVVVVVGGGK
jgi:hypothetical protein